MEPFRQRIEPSQEPEIVPPRTETRPLPSDTLKGNESKAGEEFNEKNLDLWEGLTKKRYIDEIFDTHNTSHEFLVKMPTSEIDKYIRGELEKRGYAKTIDNYKSILGEIESEIGSDKLDMFKRFTRITGYIRAISKLYKAKALKEKYLIPDASDQG